MDLQAFRRSLLQPIPKEKAERDFYEMMYEDVYQQVQALIEKVKPGATEIHRGFFYSTVMHIDNLEHGHHLLDNVYHNFGKPLVMKNSVRTVDIVMKETVCLVTLLPFESAGARKTLPYNCEMERFKIIAPQYPVSLTFRLTLNQKGRGREVLDLVVVAHSPDWYLPGLGTLIYSKNRVTVEASAPCNMFMSTVLHYYQPRMADKIEEELERQAYNLGFRTTVNVELPILELAAPK